MDNLAKDVQEESGFEHDTAIERYHDKRQSSLQSIADNYHTGSVLADLNPTEKRRLDETSLNEILSVDCPEVIRKLKLESLTEFMITLEKSLHDPYMFHPDADMIFKLNEIKHLGTEAMKTEGTRIKTMLMKTVADGIERKFNADTPLAHLSQVEVKVLRKIRPLLEDTLYPETVLSLHWRIIDDGLCEDMEKLASDPEYEVQNVKRLLRFCLDKKVPEYVKSKALKLRKLNDDAVIERLPHKYDLDSNVNELTEGEKTVLEKLNVVRNSYDPVVEYLHWEVAHVILCKEFDGFKAGNITLTEKRYIPKQLEFLVTNDRVPDKTKLKAEEFQEEILRRA